MIWERKKKNIGYSKIKGLGSLTHPFFYYYFRIIENLSKLRCNTNVTDRNVFQNVNIFKTKLYLRIFESSRHLLRICKNVPTRCHAFLDIRKFLFINMI